MLRNSYCGVLTLDLIAQTYVDALPWISWGTGEDQSLRSVKGCAMSDLAHFLRVGLRIDQLASFQKTIQSNPCTYTLQGCLRSLVGFRSFAAGLALR